MSLMAGATKTAAATARYLPAGVTTNASAVMQVLSLSMLTDLGMSTGHLRNLGERLRRRAASDARNHHKSGGSERADRLLCP